ncbi:small acid-soluble spore protein H [Paenibacillus sp. R14(2021)]|uniref:small acid-soluble spore protein H n=1 Tax=Paenibacillus sp. R14(2021) TaxID=2859228 RepID=UPI001C61353C|nr:small acid-soluble spore protein H [Paenibacillus sp. R14(2021)]
MNTQRAQEITASPVMANVTCDGVPIYIQHVDADAGTARIYPLDQPGEEQTVALSSLTEVSPFQSDGISMLCTPQHE